MTELKTLKDVYGNKANGQISVKELRAEAIKWIKSYRIKHMNGTDILLVLFDITEKDLK
jgi:hypothetical protein